MVSSRFLRVALVLAVLGAVPVLGAAAGCGPTNTVVWICLNAKTGKLDPNTHDDNNFVDGMADPCHCYDACGPAKTCPIVVDAGPLPSGCDGGTSTSAGSGGAGGSGG